MKKKSLSILIALALTTSTALVAAPKVFADTTTAATTTAPASTYGVEYEGQVQNIGWQSPITTTGDQTDINTINPAAGTEGQSLRVETLKITGTNLPAGASLTYQAHVQNIGWQPAVTTTGDTPIDSASAAGTVGQSLRMEAFKLTLNGMPGYAVKYQAHVQNKGWMSPVETENGTDISNAGEAGTDGQSLRMEALRIEIVKTDAEKAAEVNAINAVNTAVASTEEADITAANTAIASVQDATEKAALTSQLSAVNAKLEVNTLTALNADQLQVTFTQPVDKGTAETIGNYYVDGAALSSSTGAAKLQSDNKTVIITLVSGLANKLHTFDVQPITSKADASVSTPEYVTSLTTADKTAPTITSVTSSTSGSTASKATVKFSEPLKAVTFVVDGTAVPTADVALDPNDSNNETYDLSGLTLDAATTHTLSVQQATDYVPAPDANVSNLLTQTFNITTDTTAPTATVAAKDDHQIELTFSKPVNASTVVAANIDVNDETQATTLAGTTVAADPNDTTNTKFVVTIPTTDNLYAAESTRNLTVVLKNGITDTTGNALVGTSLPVTLSQDTAAPLETSMGYDLDSTQGTNYGAVKDIVLNVNKGLAVNTTGIATSGIKVIDNSGRDVSTGFLAAHSSKIADGDTKVVLPLAAETKLSGTYTFYLPAGLVTDNTNGGNTSAATVLTVNFGTAKTSTFTIPQTSIGAVTVNADKTESFNVTYPAAEEPMVGGAGANSATNTSNYTLNGAALPVGSYIVLDPAAQVATITLPAGSIAKDNATASLAISGNVASLSGDTLSPFAGYVSVEDNTAPVLQSAQYVDGNHVVLTFNEDMATGAAPAEGTDFIIKNGGVELSGDTLAAAIVPGHANQIELTLTGATLDSSKSMTITTGTSTLVKDASLGSNPMAAKTTVNIGK